MQPSSNPSTGVVLGHAHDVATLDSSRALTVLNTDPAAYAHADWQGKWAELMGHARLRASRHLLRQYGLEDREVRSVDVKPWLFMSGDQLHEVAVELALAMLGGWVRNSLERNEVAHQLTAMSAAQRSRSMRYASELRSLPYAIGPDACWGQAVSKPSDLNRLGISCLVALLADQMDGASERFAMRFAKTLVVPLELTSAQKDEALGLARRIAARTGDVP